MKHYLHAADYALWAVIMLLQFAVLSLSVFRKIHRTFPRYVAFMAFLSLQSPSLLILSLAANYKIYFYSFYGSTAVETALLLLALYDIFKAGFQPLESLAPKMLAKCVVFTAAIAALVPTIFFQLPAQGPRLFLFCRNYHRAAELTACILLWGIVLYARAWGISWRTRAIGIATGFLWYLTVQSITLGLLANIHNVTSVTWLSRIGILAFAFSLCMWARAIVCREEPASLPAPGVLRELQKMIAEWRKGNLTIERKSGLIEE